MFRALRSIRKSESFMKTVLGRFGEMLADDEFLFTQAWQSVMGEMNLDEARQPFYDKDREVNAIEQDIRRMLAEHLSIHPSPDVPGSLALMSLVKDAERIGDYSKNIFELGIMLGGMRVQDMKYFSRLSATREKIAGNFPLLQRAFAESEESAARAILDSYEGITGECNSILNDLFADDLPAREAVATALFCRYLKRVSSHVTNIASGLTYPLDQIDFVRGGILE
jgi:phosphate uptake regulator